MLWPPGLFRPLLHAIPDTQRYADFGGVIVLWAACGVPAMAWTGRGLPYPPCRDCERIVGLMPTTGLTPTTDGRSDVIMVRSSRPLADRRVVAGYTQEGLAEALGVDRTTIGRWERGAQLPQPWQRPDLAHKLGITLEQLDSLLRPQSAGADVA